MRIGADYYPEHWDRERWDTDIRMMKEAGIQVVRLGEFAWSLYEPTEGAYAFAWMDEAMDFFAANGIGVVLCTPSATPPKWMVDKYPEILQDDVHGNPKIFGTRKHYCFNSALYREKCRRLNDMIAARYAGHPALEAWQVDNELGWANTTRCYCGECEAKFKTWLEAKYQDIGNLNKAYGTVFWSQIYGSFDELIVPRAGACYDVCPRTQGQNPSLLLDYYRFCSDSVVDFTRETCAVIRRHSQKPITSNLLDAAVNSGTGIDYFKLGQTLDFVTWDNYIEFQWGIAEDATVSRDHALLRSYKKQPFWVMEQQAGPCGWSRMGPTPAPGKLRLWTYSAVANGADSVIYFRWRACPFGTEEYWHGILNHDGKPNRRYAEIAATGNEMKRLSKTYGALQPKARVAVIKSFDSEWSHSIHDHVEGFQYDKLLLDYYRPLYAMGIAVDFAAPGEDLSGYALVFAPALLMVSPAEQANLEAYAASGGRLVFSFRSGIKDLHNNMLTQTAPGAFAALAGVEVHDFDPQYKHETSVSGVFGAGVAKLWCDVIDPVTAKPLGVYTQQFFAGKPCLTVNRVGKGSVYYLGCDLDQAAMLNLMRYLGAQAGLDLPLYGIDGVETVHATDGVRHPTFILNHNPIPVVIPVSGRHTDMLALQTVEGTLSLDAFGVAILDDADGSAPQSI